MSRIKTCSFAAAQRAHDNMSPPEDIECPECPDCGGIMENNERYEQLECPDCGRVIDYSHPDS